MLSFSTAGGIRLDKDELYNHLISMIELDSIELDSIICEKNPDFIQREGELLSVSIEFKVSNITQEGLQVITPYSMRVLAHYGESMKPEELDTIPQKDIVFDILLKYTLTYSLDVNDNTQDAFLNFSNELYSLFAERNVIINVWPYAREIISDITSKMGYPPLFIPLYKNVPKN
jgi:preprotein translocase subunit SecB